MDLGKEFGAEYAPTVEKFSIYLPDHDKNEKPVQEIDAWVEAALTLMTQINGGATRLPNASGMWEDGGKTVRESTSVIYSFIRNPDKFKESTKTLATFLHKFGKQTNQGEVMFEFSGEESDKFKSRAYFIRDYSLA